MKILLLTCLTFMGLTRLDGNEILKKMLQAHAGKWHTTVTFVQTTGRYKNDTLVNTATWREALQFPENLRIDMGDRDLGNSMIFTKDSTYNFRKGKALRATTDKNDLIFLIGGMYFYSPTEVSKQFTKMGYDLNRAYETTWNGKPMYVIGVNDASEKVNQLWIDKDRLIVLRMIKYGKGGKEEAIFENHKRLANSWMETKVRFYVNDKLLQTEEYNDIETGVKLDPKIFDPKYYGKLSWY